MNNRLIKTQNFLWMETRCLQDLASTVGTCWMIGSEHSMDTETRHSRTGWSSFGTARRTPLTMPFLNAMSQCVTFIRNVSQSIRVCTRSSKDSKHSLQWLLATYPNFITITACYMGLSRNRQHNSILWFNIIFRLTHMEVSQWLGAPPNHPSHWTIAVLKPMVTWGSPIGNLHIAPFRFVWK